MPRRNSNAGCRQRERWHVDPDDDRPDWERIPWKSERRLIDVPSQAPPLRSRVRLPAPTPRLG